jgi:hypothetical protein
VDERRPLVHGRPVPVEQGIEDNDLVPVIEQVLRTATADVPGPAGNQNLHGFSALVALS